MKTIILFFVILLAGTLMIDAQVAINNTGSAPNQNAMLDVSASNKGVLIPRMTTVARTAMSLSTTEEGLTVYDTDTDSFWFWDGTVWVAVGSAAMSDDKDWIKVGTTDEAPTDVNDDMFHLGKVAIGKNTGTSPLDLYSSNAATLFNAKLENTGNEPLKLGASIDVDGTPITTKGKEGLYVTTGGDPGNAVGAALAGIETAVIGQDGIDKPEYGISTYVTGANAGTHIGLSAYLDGGDTGDRYASYNFVGGSSSGNHYLFYGWEYGSGDGFHIGNFILNSSSGNGQQFGAFNRIWNTGSGRHFGVVNEIYTKSASAHVGTANLMGIKINTDNNTYEKISGDSAAKRIGSVNTIMGDGAGIHLGEVNTIASTGDGVHVGVTNVLGHDYLMDENTATSGRHFGVVNNLTDTGDGEHAGVVNYIGLIVSPNDPTIITPVTNDSNAKRIGEMTTIGGDGDGKHYGMINSIISTGNGEHIGVSNVIGMSSINGGTGNHVGTENIIVGSGNGSRYGSVNNVMSTGDGTHIASINKVAAGGTGQHIAVYAEVDPNDAGAMAGVFKGDVTARNYVTTIPLLVAQEVTRTNDSFQDEDHIGSVFDPTIFNKLGNVEVKLVIRVTARDGQNSDHKFKLHAKKSGVNEYPITQAGGSGNTTWTYENLGGTRMYYSEWKSWSAGTDMWNLILSTKNINSNQIKFDNVYLLVRPAQP